MSSAFWGILGIGGTEERQPVPIRRSEVEFGDLELSSQVGAQRAYSWIPLCYCSVMTLVLLVTGWHLTWMCSSTGETGTWRVLLLILTCGQMLLSTSLNKSGLRVSSSWVSLTQLLPTPCYQRVFSFLRPSLFKFMRTCLLVRLFPRPACTPSESCVGSDLDTCIPFWKQKKALHGLDSAKGLFLCLTAKYTSLFKLSEPACNSSSRLFFLARWCADKTVLDYWGASVLNYAINLHKWCCCRWSKPAPEPETRWWSCQGLCSSSVPAAAHYQPSAYEPDVGYSLKICMAVQKSSLLW